ncbi:hypothetical protein D3C75_999700 [compost metagenome]
MIYTALSSGIVRSVRSERSFSVTCPEADSSEPTSTTKRMPLLATEESALASFLPLYSSRVQIPFCRSSSAARAAAGSESMPTGSTMAEGMPSSAFCPASRAIMASRPKEMPTVGQVRSGSPASLPAMASYRPPPAKLEVYLPVASNTSNTVPV